RQPAWVFRGHIHLSRFNAAVGFHYAFGHVAATKAIHQRFYCLTGFLKWIWLRRLRLCGINENGTADEHEATECRGKNTESEIAILAIRIYPDKKVFHGDHRLRLQSRALETRVIGLQYMLKLPVRPNIDLHQGG